MTLHTPSGLSAGAEVQTETPVQISPAAPATRTIPLADATRRRNRHAFATQRRSNAQRGAK